MMYSPTRLGAVKSVVLQQLGGGDVVTLALVCASPKAAAGVHQAIAERLPFDNFDFRAIAEVEVDELFRRGVAVTLTVHDEAAGPVQLSAEVVRSDGEMVRVKVHGIDDLAWVHQRDLAIRADA